MTPSQRALRAEARAWRGFAEQAALEPQRHRLERYFARVGDYALMVRGRWPREHINRRLARHSSLSREGELSSPKRNDARVIFCLLMAYECESDASRVPPESAR